MNLASIRLVTNNIDQLLGFYAKLTGTEAVRRAPDFGEIRVDGAVLAISTERMITEFNAGAAVAGQNRSAMIEFRVDDVDVIEDRMGDGADYAMKPTDMPWGNRSMLLRDPDGNVVNIFAPINRGV